MGIRGELFSTRFTCDGRTYFFNVKQNRTGDVFLSIVESKPSEGESFDRRSIVVFGEHMDGFLKSFQSALKFIDKTGTKVAPDPTAYSGHGDDDEGRRPARRSAEARPRRDFADSREGRTSSFREREPSDRVQARRSAPKSGAESGAAPRRAVRTPSEKARDGDKPLKRIVVRRVKKSDQAD